MWSLVPATGVSVATVLVGALLWGAAVAPGHARTHRNTQTRGMKAIGALHSLLAGGDIERKVLQRSLFVEWRFVWPMAVSADR